MRPFTVYDPDWKLVCLLCTELPSIENGRAVPVICPMAICPKWCQRDLLRLVNRAQRLNARIGHGRHRGLRYVGQRRIGLVSEPFEQRALARSLIANQTNFHDSTLI